MKTISYGPDEVRAAVEPSKNPKRHVFLISTGGDIICCDVENGWIRFVRPENCTLRDWGRALKAAISAMQHHLRLAQAIHDDFMDATQPNIPIALLEPKVVVNETGRCPQCGAPSDPEAFPYCAAHNRK